MSIASNLSFSTATSILAGTAGAIVYQSGVNTTAFLSIGTNGFVLTSNGSSPTWSAISGLTAGNATTATNIAAGTAGQLHYQSAPGITAFAGPGTAGQILVSGGTSAPTYTNTGSIYVNRAVLADTASAVTNAVTFNNGGTGDASGTAFNGSAARTISYNTFGAMPTTGGTFTGPVTFNQPVTFGGTATYVLSTNTFYTDNIIEMHTPPAGVTAPWFVDDGKDIGFRFHYYANSTDTNAALVLDNTSKELHWYSSGAESAAGDFSTATYGIFRTGAIRAVVGTQNQANTSTGALTVFGGVGVSGGAFFGGIVTATNFSGSLSGGTAMSVVYQSAANTTAYLAAGSAGQILQTNGTGSAPTWVSVTGLTAGNATTATNIAAGTAGQLPYQSAPGITAFAGPGTAGQILVSGGTGAPTYTNTGSIYVSRATLSDTSTNAATAYSTIGSHSAGTGLTGSAFNGSANQTWTLNTATLMATAVSAINLSAGSAMALPYQSASGTTAYLAAGTAGQILQTNSTGSAPTWVSVTGLTAGTATTATQVNTQIATASATYYPTFVDANNASATGELVYTTSSFTINPSTGFVGVGTTNATVFSSLFPARLAVQGVGNQDPLIVRTDPAAPNAAAAVFHQASTTPGFDAFRITTVGTSTTQPALQVISGVTDSTGAGGTSIFYVRQDGNVGIGTSAPAAPIHVRSGSLFPQGRRGGNASVFFFENATVADVYLEIANTVTNYSGVLFSRAAAGNYGLINYNNATDNMVFYTAGAVQHTITSAGGFAFGSSQTAYGSSGQILQSNGNAPPTWVAPSGLSAGSSSQVNTTAQPSNSSYFLTFVDTNNASAAAETVYTTSSFVIRPGLGYVGINTSSPSGPLVVSNAGAAGIEFFPSGSGVSSGPYFNSYNRSTSQYVSWANYALTHTWYVGTGGATRALDIDSSGNMFLTGGTTQLNTGFTNKLNVSGSIVAGASGSTNGTILLQGNYGTGSITNIGTEYSSGGPVVGYGVYPSNAAAGAFFSSTGAALNRGAYTISGNQHNWYVGASQTVAIGSAATMTLAMSLTSTGALAFNGASNYGSSGQVLQSNGNAAPTWVNQSAIAAGSAPLTNTYVGFGSASNLLTGSSALTWNGTVLSSTGYANFTSGMQVGSSAGLSFGASKWMVQGESTTLTRSYACGPDTSTYGSWEHYTARSNGTPVSLMRWDANGNVGVGTSSPSGKLHVYTGNASGAIAYFEGDAGRYLYTGVDAGHYIEQVGTTAGNRVLRIQSSNGSGTYTVLYFDGANQRIYTSSNVNVGIGTSTPGAKLEVAMSRTSSTSGIALQLSDNVTGAQTDGVYKSIRSTSNGGNSISEIRFIESDGTNNNTAIAFATQNTAAALTERMRITQTGALAFAGAANYGTSGQVLQSNGNAAPTWVNQSAIAAGSAPLTATYVGFGSGSNLLTGSSSLTWNGSRLYVLNGVNGWPATSGTTQTASALRLRGADNAIIDFGMNSVNTWIQATDISGLNNNYAINLNPNGGNVIIGQSGTSYASSDNTPVVGSINANKLHVNGSIQLTNNDDAIVFGRGTGSFLKDEELGFGWGGGWYMQDTTYIRVRNNKTIYSADGEIDLRNVNATASTNRIYFNSYNGPGTGGSGYGATAGGGTGLGTGITWAPSYTGYTKRSAGILQIGEGNYFRSGLAFYTNNIQDSTTDWTEAMRIGSNGNVSIGQGSAPALLNKFDVYGTNGQLFSVSDSFSGTIFAASDISGVPSIEVLDTGLVKFAQYNGSVAISTGTAVAGSALSVYGIVSTIGSASEIRGAGEITAYYSSDERLKENISVISNPIEIISQIRGVFYDWTDEQLARRGGEDGYFVRKHDIGVIAQEVEKVLPEIVATRDDGYKAVRYEKLVPLLIESIKSQQAEIDTLKYEMNEMRKLFQLLKGE